MHINTSVHVCPTKASSSVTPPFLNCGLSCFRKHLQLGHLRLGHLAQQGIGQETRCHLSVCYFLKGDGSYIPIKLIHDGLSKGVLD